MMPKKPRRVPLERAACLPLPFALRSWGSGTIRKTRKWKASSTIMLETLLDTNWHKIITIPTMEELLRKAKRVLVLEQVTDSVVVTNNGTTVMKCKETQTPF
mmetsp:Transcript_80445/g.225758  ORF Transcript_80445/g.225758 Transcript_80445/m.225758 type:complete len:102 (+) Transcript_80445:130-435(+)